MEKELRKKTVKKMEAALEAIRQDFATVRTGRASLALVERIVVDYYGTPTPLNQVASLSIPDSKQITIQPWDQKLVREIEKSIMKSDLGITPANDGKLIRLVIPALTEERRKELVKVVKKKSEDGKVAIRNIRRDVNETIKKMEKDKEISEDDLKRAMKESQELTDSYIEKIDEAVEHKEQEIMEV